MYATVSTIRVRETMSSIYYKYLYSYIIRESVIDYRTLNVNIDYTLKDLFSLDIAVLLQNYDTFLVTDYLVNTYPTLNTHLGEIVKNISIVAWVDTVEYDLEGDKWQPSKLPVIYFNVNALLSISNILIRDGYAIHELVHVKQILNGELNYLKNGDVNFRGKVYGQEILHEDYYYHSPWEIEAIWAQCEYIEPNRPEDLFRDLRFKYHLTRGTLREYMDLSNNLLYSPILSNEGTYYTRLL